MDRTDEVGYRVWDEFYAQMSHRYGACRGRSQYWSHKFYKTFRRIADKCLGLSIDPTDYVATVLSVLGKEHAYITPKDLSTDDAFQGYSEYRKSKGGSQVKATWVEHVDRLTDLECRAIPSFYPNEEMILLSPQLTFYAWFRVLYPEAFSELLFASYGQSAWTELQQDIRLRRFLRSETVPVHVRNNLKELERRIGYFGDTVVEGEGR